jgi:undecaprenyl-diphosphatase
VNWDSELFLAINSLAERSAAMDRLMLAFGEASNLLVPGVLAFGFWVWQKRKEAVVGAAVLGGLFLLGDLLGAQVKHLIGRVRPCHVLTGVHQLTGCGGTFSFPSNHALNLAAAAAFLHILYPRTGWITWPVVLVAGLSRVYVGAHYVTDVLGGWLIGGLLGTGTALVLLRWSVFGGRLAGHPAGESRPAS